MDPKALFVYYFDLLPNVSYITSVDIDRAYPFIKSQVDFDVLDFYQYSQFNRDVGRMEFNVTYIVLRYDRLIEVGADYVSILHSRTQSAWAINLVQKMADFRVNTSTGKKIGFAVGQEANN
jgi:hypothetical protein